MTLLNADALRIDAQTPAGAQASRQVWPRLWGNRASAAALVFLATVGLLALGAPLLVRIHVLADPYRLRLAAPNTGPTRQHLLGVDYLGRDLLARTVYGARVSLSIAFLVQLATLVIGGSLGLLAGYAGRRTDNVLMRLTDVAYAFPSLLFVLFIAAVRGPGYWNILLAIAVVRWPFLARLVRAEVRALKDRPYIEAARATGIGPGRVLTRHIVPNALGPVIVTMTFGVPAAIYFETFLSYLGVGIRPPTPTWGAMINTGYQTIFAYPHEIMAPAVAISLVTLACNLVGDGLRDALDPRTSDRRLMLHRRRGSPR